MTAKTYDYIIVGGGSAGCVLANRLSAAPGTEVLVIEAGMDTPPGEEPADILDSYPIVAYFNPLYQWAKLRVHQQAIPHNMPGATSPEVRYEQARVMGGGSSINAQLANRGAPRDYEDWVSLGADGWGWENVLPYFRKVENDQDFDGPYHGKDGHIPVRRIWHDQWPDYTKQAAKAFEGLGRKYIPDQNGEFEDGWFPMTFSNVDDHRVSAAMGYLNRDVRARQNLTIMAETQVRRILFEGAQAVGVEVQRRGAAESVRGREIILCAGGIHSPAMLMRSGVGPGSRLREHGIGVIADLQGVGQNLMDHPSIGVSAYIKKSARLPHSLRRHLHIAQRYSSGLSGCQESDMYMTAVTKSAWHPLGWRLGSFLLWVNRSYSTGQVTLKTSDWQEEPKVEFNLLSDRRDLERLMQGVRIMAGLFEMPEMKTITDTPFPSSYSERVRSVGTVTTKNYVLTSALGYLLDTSKFVRRRLVDTLVTEGVTLKGLLQDDDALEAFIRKNSSGVWHASCTNRMGRADDPMSVTDTQGRVKKLGNLRVVDASIMPQVPCANTNFPVMMMAEKIADSILAD